MPPNLSKSRFVAGWQCHKLLWLKVHEPKARELEVDVVLQDRFRSGRPGRYPRAGIVPGRSADRPSHDDPWRVEATRKAIDDGVPAVFEATFIEDRVYVVHRRAGADGRWIHPHRGQVVQQGEG